jgi:hypothetical protein
MSETPRAFVIMPFDPEFRVIYDDLIKPALEEAGYDVSRADEPLDRRNVLMDVIKGLVEADLVVADLTTANANVFYELGVAHGLRKPTVLLAQRGEDASGDVPFDLRSYRIEFYSTRFDEVHRLKSALRDVGRAALEGEIEFRDPLSDFGPVSDVPVNAATKRPTRTHQPDGEDDDAGLFDHLEALESSSTDLEEIMERITAAIVDVGDDMERHTTRFEAVNEAGGPGSTGEVRRMLRTVASDLTRFARRLKDEDERLEDIVNTYTGSGLSFVRALPLDTDERRVELEETKHTVDQLLATVRTTRSQLKELRTSVSALPGLAREVNQAKRQAVSALDLLDNQNQRVEAYAEQVVRLADDRLRVAASPESSDDSAD